MKAILTDDKISAKPRHRCTDQDCPYLGQPSPAGSCRCHKTSEKMLLEQRDELLALLKIALTCIDDCHTYRSHLHFKEEKQIKDALERIASVEAAS